MVKTLDKCDIRLGYHSPNNHIQKYGSDNSENQEYIFNSLGFRGDEYNSKLASNIYISGCSYTFGVGLSYEETWGSQFKKILAEKIKGGISNIGLMNFAVGGASNDYIARSLLNQSSLIKPDLVIAYFTHSSRIEFVDGSSIKMIGPWSVNLDFKGSKGDQLHLDDLEEEALDYYSYTTPELEFVNMIKNMLLLQSFCESRKINFLFGSVYKDDLFNNSYVSNPVCAQLVALINKKHYCSFNLDKVDTASDGSHPGPKSNRIFAEKLFKTYEHSIV